MHYNKIYILLFYLLFFHFLHTVQANPLDEDNDYAIMFAYINDNYSATWVNGNTENYFGADDFLTASFLLRMNYNKWKAGLTYNIITSRLYNFRYDLLTISAGQEQTINNFSLDTQLGLINKGDLGGKNLQNSWHRLTGLSRIHIPYSTHHGLAAFARLNGLWTHKNQLINSDLLSIWLELKVASDFVPWRVSPAIAYQVYLINDALQFEVLAGWRFYLNEIDEYSEMVRPGFMTAVNLKWNTFKNLFLDLGFSMQPVRNLAEEPRYGNGRFRYLPQMWLGFSWNTGMANLIDYIDY